MICVECLRRIDGRLKPSSPLRPLLRVSCPRRAEGFREALQLDEWLRGAVELLPLGKPGPMGGEGKVIEADETYLGKRDGLTKPVTPKQKVKAFLLWKRKLGR